MPEVKFGELIQGERGMVARAFEFDTEPGIALQFPELVDETGLVDLDALIVAVHVHTGIDDWPVTGTTAQVSRQRIVDLRACRRRVVVV